MPKSVSHILCTRATYCKHCNGGPSSSPSAPALWLINHQQNVLLQTTTTHAIRTVATLQLGSHTCTPAHVANRIAHLQTGTAANRSAPDAHLKELGRHNCCYCTWVMQRRTVMELKHIPAHSISQQRMCADVLTTQTELPETASGSRVRFGTHVANSAGCAATVQARSALLKGPPSSRDAAYVCSSYNCALNMPAVSQTTQQHT